MSAHRAFTRAGHIVVMPGLFDTATGATLDQETKRIVDDLHYKRIDMADIIFVVNPGGYLSDATKREIEYATTLGKQVRYLESR